MTSFTKFNRHRKAALCQQPPTYPPSRASAKTSIVAFGFAMALFAPSLHADGLPDLAAERPGFTTPSAPVGLGVLQLEQGYTYEWAKLSGSRFGTASLPQALVRFGITNFLELRFATTGYTSQLVKSPAGQYRVSGPNDYLIGAKFRLIKQTELRPEFAVIGQLALPGQKSPFTSSGHDPYFTIAADKDLPRKFSLIANLNLASVSDTQGRFYSSGEGVWLTRTMHYASPFVEVFHTTIGRDLGSELVTAAGVYRMLGKHAQFDVEVGHTMAGERPSMYASLGLVIRAPQALLGPERIWFRK